jgi:spermidine synthase
MATVLSCLSAVTLWATLPPYAKTDAFIKHLPDGSYGEFRDGQLENKILRFKEGQTSTVTIRESVATAGIPAFRRVYVDEQRVAATDLDAAVDSKMLAHLPAMLHPNPQRALSVGYGSGGTSWSLALYDGLQARTVEIEGEILKSAQLFPYRNVWNKPNFKAIHNDARDHLQTTDDRYDFISTDVTNLQYNQNATLYTAEYFGMMRDRLTKDGIACAWIPMSAISLESFRTLLATFQHVYPHSSLWLMNEIPTYFGILIGTKEPLRIDMRRMGAVMANKAVGADLESIGIQHPYQIAASLLLDEAGMRSFTADAPLHTDDDPVLEHAANYHNYLYYNDFVMNLEAALKYRPTSVENLIVGLSTEQQAEFEKVWVASGHWYEAFAALSAMNVASDRSTLNSLAARATVSAREAMHAHSGWRSWQDLYARIEQSYGPAVSRP